MTELSQIKWAWKYIALFLYFLIGSVVFYIIEHNQSLTLDSLATTRDKCIGGHDGLSPAFYYTMSACSTIGFGVIYPCTAATRILSVVYSCFGIPLLLFVLADIGAHVSQLIGRCCARCYCKANRQTMLHKSDSEACQPLTDEPCRRSSQFLDHSGLSFGHERRDIPIWLGIVLTLCCISFCAGYYNIVEEWTRFESVYFSFTAFLNGDFQTTNFPAACVMFFFIFMGFSMLSTTIQIVQNNIRNAISRVKQDMELDIRRIKFDRLGSMAIEDFVSEFMAQNLTPLTRSMITTNDIEALLLHAAHTVDVVGLEHEIQEKDDILAGGKSFANASVMARPQTATMTSSCVGLTEAIDCNTECDMVETRNQGTIVRVRQADVCCQVTSNATDKANMADLPVVRAVDSRGTQTDTRQPNKTNNVILNKRINSVEVGQL